jgi:hypothetical protein
MKRFLGIGRLCGGLILATGVAAGIIGCSTDGHPSFLPNPDPALRKTSAELASDAAKRNYEADAPRGGQAAARAEFELMAHRFDVVNLSDTDWNDVEVWVNQQYVILVPAMPKEQDKKLDFEMFYDRDGHHFDTQGGKNPIKTLEIYRDGKLFTVPATQE